MDFPYNDIVTQSMQKWGITDRQAKRYISKAYESFAEITEKNVGRRLNYHIQKRMKLLRDIAPPDRNTPAGISTALRIIQDIAKLEGFYVEKHEHSGPDGGPIHTETKHEVIFKDYSGGQQQ